jgi:hypothetical protein
MANMDNTTGKLLKEYLSQGGRILSFTREIPYVDGLEHKAMQELMETYSSQWTFATTTNDPVVRDLFKQVDFAVTESDPVQGEFYFQRRIMDDGQLLFFVNSDTLTHARASITAAGQSLVRMDLVTGKCYQVPAKPEKDMISFDIDLPPVGSSLYYLSDQALSEPVEKLQGTTYESVPAKGEMTVRAEADNVMVINYMDVSSKRFDVKDVYFMKAMHMLYDSNGFTMGNPWQHKIQYEQDYLVLDTFSTGSGFEVNYHFSVTEGVDLMMLRDLSAVVERPELWDVFLNGKKLDKSEQWWIDRDFFRFPLGDMLKKGDNILSLKAQRMSVHAELMPAYIIGNFILKPTKKGFEITAGNIIKPGSWKANGYPFYGQEISYARKFDVADEGAEYKVILNKWNGTLAEVMVNGASAGLILWPPYELNIGSLIKTGENEIVVKVTGSLKNTFGYFYKNNKQWINGPGDWDTAPDGNPSYDKYFLMNYGLFEPFGLVRIE